MDRWHLEKGHRDRAKLLLLDHSTDSRRRDALQVRYGNSRAAARAPWHAPLAWLGESMSIALRCLGLWVLLFVAGGCSTLPQMPPRTASMTLPAARDGMLVAIARTSTPSPELSGFRLLPLGSFSLDARMQLIRRAQQSLDLQYYHIENDQSGLMLLQGLHDAALRGVRVRLLVDDLHTSSIEPLLFTLASVPNAEVRLFNPFCCGRRSVLTRYAASLVEFRRLNQRMHNKLLIADSVMAIAGGRNIANEYFTRNPLQNFVDMDAFIIGSTVPQLGSIFDRYWNSDSAWPVQFIVVPDARTQAAAGVLRRPPNAEDSVPLQELAPVDVLGYGPLGEELESGQVGLIWGTAYAFADSPAKVMNDDDEYVQATSVFSGVGESILTAEREVVLSTPYLIPGDTGMRIVRNLRARGVKLSILTNSLAANDSPIAHAGYSRYRKELLREGAVLHELSPERTARNRRFGVGKFASSLGRLHAKIAVVDRRTVFIGSTNLDPRSKNDNTELGILVDSPQLAAEMVRVLDISKLQSSYRVRLGADGHTLEWLVISDGRETILRSEPESTFGTRLQNMLLVPLVPECLL